MRWEQPAAPPSWPEVAAWYVARWRARRAVYYADLDYRREETPDHLARLIRARDHLRRLEWNPPR